MKYEYPGVNARTAQLLEQRRVAEASAQRYADYKYRLNNPNWFLNSNKLGEIESFVNRPSYMEVFKKRSNYRKISNNLEKKKRLQEIINFEKSLYNKAMRTKANRKRLNNERRQYGRRSRDPRNYINSWALGNNSYLRVHPKNESPRTKIKRLIEIYTNPSIQYHNKNYPLTNRNKLMFSVKSLSGNNIFGLLEKYQKNLSFKMKLPQRKPINTNKITRNQAARNKNKRNAENLKRRFYAARNSVNPLNFRRHEQNPVILHTASLLFPSRLNVRKTSNGKPNNVRAYLNSINMAYSKKIYN